MRGQQFAEKFCIAFTEGELAEIAQLICLPFLLEIDDHSVAMTDHEAVMDWLRERRERLAAVGVVNLSVRVTAEQIAVQGRSRFWVDWTYLGASGQTVASTHSVLFCRTERTGLMLEMARFSDLPFPLPEKFGPGRIWP